VDTVFTLNSYFDLFFSLLAKKKPKSQAPEIIKVNCLAELNGSAISELKYKAIKVQKNSKVLPGIKF
jgi:hypothetical protein